MKRKRDSDPLDQAFDELEELLPDWLLPTLRWMRSPKSRAVRIPIGILLILGSFLWFLPVLGVEMLPIGLLLIAQDVPFLRRPVGRLTLWMIDCYTRMQRAWRQWRARHRSSRP